MVVDGQIIPLGKPVAPFTRQFLQYQWVPHGGVAVDTFV